MSITAGRQWRLSVFNLGLACCAVEFVAAIARSADLAENATGVPGDGAGMMGASPARVVDVLVVSGTVTLAMAAGIEAAYDDLPASSRRVLAFGACATTGGPYWDSYAVVQGVDALIPVDVYVPGCPPRPEALLQGLGELDRLLLVS